MAATTKRFEPEVLLDGKPDDAIGPNGGGITDGEYNFQWFESKSAGGVVERRFYRDARGERWYIPARPVYGCYECDEDAIVNGQLCPVHATARAHAHDGRFHAHVWSDERDQRFHRHYDRDGFEDTFVQYAAHCEMPATYTDFGATGAVERVVRGEPVEAGECAECGHLHFYGLSTRLASAIYSRCPIDGCGCWGQK